MLTRFVPSPALVVACVSLLIALGGTAYAAGVVPLAKRALAADDARKLQGRSMAQVTAKAAAMPGPASTVSGLVTTKTAPWSLTPGDVGEFVVSCDSGQKAVAGGYEASSSAALAFDSRPTSDGTGWQIVLAGSNSALSNGTLYAVCIK
jgi:hypothetical protein